MGDFSYILFAQPSFLGGAASVLDFGDTLAEYNRSLTPEQADRIALRADARQVAADFYAAVGRFCSLPTMRLKATTL